MENTIHRCTDKGCPFVGQVTSKSCGCHKTAEQMLKERVEELEAALAAIDALEVMEINPSNYDHELVCELSSNAAQAACIARDALAKAGA